MFDYMETALELADEALAAQEVPVGCVFVYQSKIIAKSRNTVNETRNPTRHAEVNCVDQVLQYSKKNNLNYRDVFKHVSVFVTVEPCIMCAAILQDLNVVKVVYGCANDRFGGKTVLDVSTFYKDGYVLEGNVKEDEAMTLLKEFYKGSNPLAPESKQRKKKSTHKQL